MTKDFFIDCTGYTSDEYDELTAEYIEAKTKAIINYNKLI